MTSHLTPEEFIDALGEDAAVSPLSADRLAHIAVCRTCAAQVSDMRALMNSVHLAGEVPEPSPLFWDHLSARVRDAVDATPVPVSQWDAWRASWRPMLAMAGVLGVVALTLTLSVWRSSSVSAPASSKAVASAAEGVTPAEGSEAMWDMIGTLAPDVHVEHAYGTALQPGRGTTDAAIDALTDAQRRALVKLLRAEMGSAE